jgi:micrococcal nuclease
MTKKNIRVLFSLLVIIISVVTFLFNEVTKPDVSSSPSSKDSHVQDNVGDTISVYINGTSQTIRLIGINTPETVDPRKPVQCYGKEASRKAKELLIGKRVILEKDESQGDYDRYQRLLTYIYLEDGTFFNKYMIENGYAYEYTYDTPYKYQQEFKAAQKSAQELKKGLWNPEICTQQ